MNTIKIIILVLVGALYADASPMPGTKFYCEYPSYIWGNTKIADYERYAIYDGNNWIYIWHPDIGYLFCVIEANVKEWSGGNMGDFRFFLTGHTIVLTYYQSCPCSLYKSELSKWVYSQDLGWSYWPETNTYGFYYNSSGFPLEKAFERKGYQGTGATGGWFWCEKYGWAWTAEGTYPWVWCWDQNKWLNVKTAE